MRYNSHLRDTSPLWGDGRKAPNFVVSRSACGVLAPLPGPGPVAKGPPVGPLSSQSDTSLQPFAQAPRGGPPGRTKGRRTKWYPSGILAEGKPAAQLSVYFMEMTLILILNTNKIFDKSCSRMFVNFLRTTKLFYQTLSKYNDFIRNFHSFMYIMSDKNTCNWKFFM